jgi:hypothetical protein
MPDLMQDMSPPNTGRSIEAHRRLAEYKADEPEDVPTWFAVLLLAAMLLAAFGMILGLFLIL